MFGKALFFRLLRAIAIVSFKIIVVVGLILILDVIGLGLYGFFRGINAFGMLRFILILESVVLMFLGVMGTTVLPQARVIGVPWSKSVRAATEEIRKDRQRQVQFWIQVGIAGLILFFIALIFSIM